MPRADDAAYKSLKNGIAIAEHGSLTVCTLDERESSKDIFRLPRDLLRVRTNPAMLSGSSARTWKRYVHASSFVRFANRVTRVCSPGT